MTYSAVYPNVDIYIYGAVEIFVNELNLTLFDD